MLSYVENESNLFRIIDIDSIIPIFLSKTTSGCWLDLVPRPDLLLFERPRTEVPLFFIKTLLRKRNHPFSRFYGERALSSSAKSQSYAPTELRFGTFTMCWSLVREKSTLFLLFTWRRPNTQSSAIRCFLFTVRGLCS